MSEKWKRVDGFPEYKVSTEGNIRSYKDSHGRAKRLSHIIKARTNPNGYRIAVLYDDQHTPHQMSVHRLVAKAFIPDFDESLVVDHLDGDKSNNSLSNLELVTGRENSRRAVKNGLYEPIFEKTRRPVVVTDLRTGSQMYFRGVNDASRAIGYSSSIISRAANMEIDKVGHYFIEFAGPEERLLYT